MKIIIILGTRPEIIKMAPVILLLKKRKINFEIIHTGQHFSQNMDAIFWQRFKLPKPKYHLSIQEKSHAKQVSKMIHKIDHILDQEKPDWIFVHGDTNSTVSGALASCKKTNIKIAHIEAGLRSFDKSMPEEINRIITDHVSTILFAPTSEAKRQLLKENIERHKIKVVGNTIEDALLSRIDKIKNNSSTLKQLGLIPKKYVLLTIHRQENTSHIEKLMAMTSAIFESASRAGLLVVFPVHPRTRQLLDKIKFVFPDHVKVLEPLGYDDFLALELHARLLATDSGGLQEEGCILKVPVITLRENTERPETLRIGSNILAGSKPATIRRAFSKMLKSRSRWKSPYGGGQASARILDIILNYR